MKKLALVLGSLLVVGTAASAKEVVPAPVVVPERVVEIVEKPVIVYRDREVAPAWRPNGSFDMQYRWYGETENKSVKDDTDKDWARSQNNYGRLQTVTNINFTEKQNLNVRTRSFQTLKSASDKDSTRGTSEIRARYNYKLGALGNSKVTATPRLEYRQWENSVNRKRIEASVAFNFADYLFSNDYIKTDSFVLRPVYRYQWEGSDYYNEYGVDLETYFTLPLNFEFEFNAYNRYTDYKDRIDTTKGSKGGEYRTWIEAYIYNNTSLYKNGNFDLSFYFEGGYDPYTIGRYRHLNADGSAADRREYELYALPALKVTYKPTDFVQLYAAAGAEYRNWAVTAESKAKNWRWQPTAWAGMKVTF